MDKLKIYIITKTGKKKRKHFGSSRRGFVVVSKRTIYREIFFYLLLDNIERKGIVITRNLDPNKHCRRSFYQQRQTQFSNNKKKKEKKKNDLLELVHNEIIIFHRVHDIIKVSFVKRVRLNL